MSLNLWVLTYANYRDQLVDEWEQSVVNNGYKNYKIIGNGEVWQGFINKINGYYNEIQNGGYKNDDVIILCDCFDLLFLQGPDEILKRFNEKTNNGEKILTGAESICLPLVCNNNQTVCDRNLKGENQNQSEDSNENRLKYLNSGFIMGKYNLIKAAYDEMYGMANKSKDDQYLWSRYRIMYCDLIVLDTDSSVVLNYLNDQEIEIQNNENQKIIYNITNNNYPCVIHIYAQGFNPLKRSEYVRSELFPGRKQVGTLEYFNKTSKKLFKMELYQFLIIYICLIILFTGILVYIIKNRFGFIIIGTTIIVFIFILLIPIFLMI